MRSRAQERGDIGISMTLGSALITISDGQSGRATPTVIPPNTSAQTRPRA